MSIFSTSSTLGGGAQQADYSLPSPPSDGISSLSFHISGSAMVAGSWDQKVRCWTVQRTAISAPPVATPMAEIAHNGPVLCTSFHHTSSTAFSGGADNVVKAWDLQGAGHPSMDIGKHDAPVRKMAWIPSMSLLATGSWDKTIRFWDMKQPNPVHTMTLSERVYDLEVRDNWLVVCTADRKNSVYNLGANCKLESVAESTLKYQTRCAAIFPDQTGYAVGSIEGRVAIEYFSELPNETGVPRALPASQTKRGFAFKCHRETLPQNKSQTGVFSINSIAFHPYGTFATAGSDGTFNFWDKDSRQRLKQFPKQATTISTAAFSPDGSLYAYAVSYDWSQGVGGAQPGLPHEIKLHVVTDDEIKPRDKPRK
ncbi:WD40-repeat-containing domain protein [Tribonema minus]|uniref:WD40-repeat-containing domain protein n=1 Tax=Tribonema minus TaxID=303371 RepID=A0A835ZCU3_9STRA|nr:WD40-repeat-containing domain protein [Tribonema minus]